MIVQPQYSVLMSLNNQPNVNAPVVAYWLTEEQISSLATRIAEKVAENAKASPVVISNDPAWISRKEASERLGVSLPTLHSLLKRGALIAKKVGSRTLIDRADMMATLVGGQLAKYKRTK